MLLYFLGHTLDGDGCHLALSGWTTNARQLLSGIAEMKAAMNTKISALEWLVWYPWGTPPDEFCSALIWPRFYLLHVF